MEMKCLLLLLRSHFFAIRGRRSAPDFDEDDLQEADGDNLVELGSALSKKGSFNHLMRGKKSFDHLMRGKKSFDHLMRGKREVIKGRN